MLVVVAAYQRQHEVAAPCAPRQHRGLRAGRVRRARVQEVAEEQHVVRARRIDQGVERIEVFARRPARHGNAE